MSKSPYDLNRPIHLGRRDAFIERAAELFRRCQQESSAAKRAEHADAALYYLHSALEHSSMAAKSTAALPDEEPVILALRTLVFCIHSLIALFENEAQLKNGDGLLARFLAEDGDGRALEGINFGSGQLLKDTASIFELTSTPLLRLRRDILGAMDAQDKARYENTFESVKKHIRTRSHQRHAVMHGRISCPVLLSRYE